MRVRAASVDRGTWHIMTGLPTSMRLVGFGLRAPKAPNPGRSLAGTVEAVGKGVTEFSRATRCTAPATVPSPSTPRPSGRLARKPANLSFEQAAAVPVSALAALQACATRKVRPGQSVLIIGASGGVGTFAVQIAKALGAEVTGVCSTAKVDLVRGLGADHVIDYTREDFADGSTLRRDPRHRRQPPSVTLRRALTPAARSSSSEAKPADGGSAASTASSERFCCPVRSQKLTMVLV